MQCWPGVGGGPYKKNGGKKNKKILCAWGRGGSSRGGVQVGAPNKKNGGPFFFYSYPEGPKGPQGEISLGM